MVLPAAVVKRRLHCASLGLCTDPLCLPVCPLSSQVALTHVVMGIVMVLLSSWRVRMWRRACHDEDDVHATRWVGH